MEGHRARLTVCPPFSASATLVASHGWGVVDIPLMTRCGGGRGGMVPICVAVRFGGLSRMG